MRTQTLNTNFTRRQEGAQHDQQRATRSAGASHLKKVLEKNGLMMPRVRASQHFHDKNYVLETVILTMGAYKEVFSNLGEKELPVKK